MILEALIAVAGIAAIASRSHISVIIRKDSTDMATIHEQLADLETKVAAIPTGTAFDPAPLQAALDALNAKVDALAADVGTPPVQ